MVIVQEVFANVSGTSAVTLPVPPTPGNTLVCMCFAYNNVGGIVATGWTQDAPSQAAIRVATSTDALSTTVTAFSSITYSGDCVVWELAGTGTVLGSSTQYTSTFVNPYTNTPVVVANCQAIALSLVTCQAGVSATVSAGWTVDGMMPAINSFFGEVLGIVSHRPVVAAGSYTNTVTFDGTAGLLGYGVETHSMIIIGSLVPVLAPGLASITNKYRLVLYDANHHIVVVPQDVLSFSFEDVVNGGSGQGSFVLKRAFVDEGWLNYQYRVQLYLGSSPYPWYDGRVIEIDPSQLNTNDSETITVQCEGWSTQMANAIVSEILTPSATAGTMNADTYLTHLIGTYLDSSMFGASYIASIPLALDGLTFDGQELNTCIDAVVKQITDISGQIYEWWVRGGIAGTLPAIVIQPQQNPNLVSGPSYFAPGAVTTTQCMVEFKDKTIYQYQIQNASRGIYNMIALYGGTLNGVQVYGAFKDSTSMSLYGVRQKKVTNSVLLSTTTLAQYATTWLACNAYPQPAGSFFKYSVSDFARAGQWFQVMEDAAVSNDMSRFVDFSTNDLVVSTTQNVKQVRAVRVVITLQEGMDRIEQEVFTTAPRPFIDHAFYGAINYVAGKTGAAQGFAGPTQLATYYLAAASLPVIPNVPVANLIADSIFATSSYKSGRATSPYNMKWSFSLIDNISFWLALAGSIGTLVVDGHGSPLGNCRALSAAFTLNPGTYHLSFVSTAAFIGPRWSIVADLGSGLDADAYASASLIYTLAVPVGTSTTSSGSYVYTAVPIKARVLFESESYSYVSMSTWSPVLAYTP